MNELIISNIKRKILTIRGIQVIMDSDIADLYSVPVKALNQAVKRNHKRFPENFMFQLTEKEVEILRSQIVTSNSNWGGRRYLPYVFTEQGVSMLSGILKSTTAVQVSINIMNAFVAMRKFISQNAYVFQRLDRVELKQLEHEQKFEKVFTALETNEKNKEYFMMDKYLMHMFLFVI